MKQYLYTLITVCTVWISSCDKVDELLDPYEAPVIENIEESINNVSPGDTVRITVTATNPEEGLLYFAWSSTPEGGRFVLPADDAVVEWIAPFRGGNYRITVKVSNEEKSSEAYVNIVVKSTQKPILEINAPENGSHHIQYNELNIESIAYHENFISKVWLYINGALIDSSDYQSSDKYNFTIIAGPELIGETTITLVAFTDAANLSSERSVIIFVEGILPGKGKD